jgi:hypothetical protein
VNVGITIFSGSSPPETPMTADPGTVIVLLVMLQSTLPANGGLRVQGLGVRGGVFLPGIPG